MGGVRRGSWGRGGRLSISIWLQWLEGEDRGDLSALFLDRYDLRKKKRFSHRGDR